MSVGPEPKRLRLSETELNDLTKEELLERWTELEKYLDHLETKSNSDGQKENSELVSLRESEEKLKQQQSEATRRENVLVMRLTTKEQEMQEYAGQIQELKRSQVPSVAQLRSSLLDPAVNLMFERMKKGLDTTKAKLEDTQNDLSAWKFTPDSNTGKRLMAKCRLLHQENEELGKIISSGRVAKLEGDLALQRNFSEEMKKSQADLDEFLMELDEDVEGMQSTIYYLQQQLRESKEALTKLQQENILLKSPVSEKEDISNNQSNMKITKMMPSKNNVGSLSPPPDIALVGKEAGVNTVVCNSENAVHPSEGIVDEVEAKNVTTTVAGGATTATATYERDDVEMADVLDERTTTTRPVSPRLAFVSISGEQLEQHERLMTKAKEFDQSPQPPPRPKLITEANSNLDLENEDQLEQRTRGSLLPQHFHKIRTSSSQMEEEEQAIEGEAGEAETKSTNMNAGTSDESSNADTDDVKDAQKCEDQEKMLVVASRTIVGDADLEMEVDPGDKLAMTTQEELEEFHDEQTTEAIADSRETTIQRETTISNCVGVSMPSPESNAESGTEDLLIDCGSIENGRLDDDEDENDQPHRRKSEEGIEKEEDEDARESRTQSPRTPLDSPSPISKEKESPRLGLRVDSRTHSSDDQDSSESSESSDSDSNDGQRDSDDDEQDYRRSRQSNNPNCLNSKKGGTTLNGLADALSMPNATVDESDSTL